jgi:hypothetical protein
MPEQPQPCMLKVDDEAIADLRERLARRESVHRSAGTLAARGDGLFVDSVSEFFRPLKLP